MALLAGHSRGTGEAEFAQTTFEQLAEDAVSTPILQQPHWLNRCPWGWCLRWRGDGAGCCRGDDNASHAVVERVSELLALGMDWEARTEFRGLDDPDIALSLAELAASSGRHSWAIEAAAAAGAWGRVDLRFPVVFEDEFENAAEESGLSVEALSGCTAGECLVTRCRL